jgi:hypothetical protein
MKALLKKSCTRCTESSLKTYYQSILALAKLAGRESIPDGPAWLNGALLKKVRALPLQRYKRFSIAGVKALNAYKVTDNKQWWDAMRDATEKYTKLRMSGKRTKREADRWPTGGYTAIRKLAKRLHSEVSHLEERKPKDLTAWQRYQYQRYLILLFYSHHAMRGDLADVEIGRKGARSWVRRKGKKWTLHIGHHKTIKSRGPIEFVLDDEVSAAFSKFVPMVRAAKLKHSYLLSTSRGEQLQRQDMLKLVSNTTEKYLHKKIGIQILRVLKTTDKLKDIDTALELQHELGHGPEMQKQYLSRPKGTGRKH